MVKYDLLEAILDPNCWRILAFKLEKLGYQLFIDSVIKDFLVYQLG